MALLEIFDPKAPPTPVGIDLGTTHSLVAYVKDGRPRVVADCDGRKLLPSVVHYDGKGGVLVGATAQRRAAEAPRSTLSSVKRFMGRGADDAETRRPSPYVFVARGEGDPNVVRLDVGAAAGDKVVTPVEASAEILRALKRLAEDDLRTLGGVVITVPAYFDDAQRQATKDAGRLAGLEVLRLLNEPTAAALAYGLDQKANGLFVVYDLGGGTFDVTVLRLEDGVFQVLATGGDSALGGDDMDRALAEALVAERGLGLDALTPVQLRVLFDAARAAKHGLTDAAEVELDHPLGGAPAVLTRTAFDAAIAPLLERTGKAARRALRDAQVEPSALDGVILVGGSTRVPAVRTYVERLFGQPPLADIDPDEVVALGAAVQASLLAGHGETDDVLLLDVTPLSLGIEVGGGVVDKILPRNTTVPTAARATYTTQEDKQTGFELHVVQGERELAADCRSLARFTLAGIPPMPAGLARLEVTFRVDADGLLEVHARETTTGLEQRVEVKPSYGLDDETVEEMLLAAIDHGEEDLLARQLAEARTEARRVVVATRASLAADPALVEDAERAGIEEAMARLEAACERTDARAVRLRLEDLEHATKPFAERRMNQAIARALEGRDLGALEREVAEAKGLENAHTAPDLGTK